MYLYKKSSKAFLIWFIGMVWLSGCATVGADLKSGKEARRAGDFQKAEQNLKPLAEFGVPEAKYEYALTMLSNPKATPDEQQQAHKELIALADTGYAGANFEVARSYEKQDDLEAAEKYYKRAAEQGNARALFQLGVLAEKKRDFDGAEGLYKQALEGHYYKAAERIGRLYEKGLGREKDPGAALSWYEQAREQGVSGLEERIAGIKAGQSPE